MVFPAYYPLPALPAVPASLPPVRPQRPRLAPDCWPEIAARAQRESLRDLAATYGVCHETIRTIIQRTRHSTSLPLPAAD